jgi:hypothetical protein
MVELNHNIKNVNASVLVKGDHGVIVGIHVSKTGSSGAKLELKNGTVTGSPLELTVYGESIQNIQDINRRFEAGIYATVTGSAEYVIIYK